MYEKNQQKAVSEKGQPLRYLPHTMSSTANGLDVNIIVSASRINLNLLGKTHKPYIFNHMLKIQYMIIFIVTK